MQASEALLLVVASLVFGLDTNLVHAEDSGVSSIREAMSLSPAKLFQEGQDKDHLMAVREPKVMLIQESSEIIESSHPGYKFGNQGGKTCANGGTPITNREQCDSALKSLGIQIANAGTLSPGSNVCYKSGNGKGYNNGRNGGGAWLICKVSVSPTTATPTTATPTTATPTTATPTTASGDEMTKALVQDAAIAVSQRAATNNQPENKTAATDNQPLPRITECCALKKKKKDCIPHPGLTFQNGTKWYEPYQHATLAPEYRNIPHKVCNEGVCKIELVDCNPASCDNPPVCGLPECWVTVDPYSVNSIYLNAQAKIYPSRELSRLKFYDGVSTSMDHFLSIRVNDLNVPANKRNQHWYKKNKEERPGWYKKRGKLAEKQGVKLWYNISSFEDQFPNKENGFMAPTLLLPALRQGTADMVSNDPGFINCFPTPGSKRGGIGALLKNKGYSKFHPFSVGWPIPESCNPHGLLSCSKTAWAHTGVKNEKDSMIEAVLLYKSSWCINGVCPCDKKGKCSTDCPARCYVKKAGRCFKFTGNYVPDPKVHGRRDKFNRGNPGKYVPGDGGKAARDSVYAPMPAYPEDQNRLHAMFATKEAVAGRYTHECSEEGIAGTQNVIAGA